MEKELKPKLRFKEFDHEWSNLLLKDKVYIYDGTHQTPKYVKSGVQFLSVEHLTSNNFARTKFISEEIYKKENLRVKLEKGDILMTRIGDIGTAKYLNWDVRASFYVSLALIKRKNEINLEFLSHYINTDIFQSELWKRTIHVAFPKKINLGEIGECRVRLPEIQEQQKIASFLSSVDSYIENLKQQKEALEKYKKGMMQKIFSQQIRFKDESGKEFPEWEEKRIGELATFRRGSFPQPYGLAKWYDDTNGDPFVQVFDVDSNMKLKSKTKQKISNAAKPNSVFVKKGTVIVTIQGSIGRVALTQYDCYLDRTLLLFQSYKIPLNKTFFAYTLELLFNIEKAKAPGGTIKTITKEVLTSFKVKIPTVKEQNQITEFFTKQDDLIEAKHQQIEKAEEWKKGLLQQLFI